MKCPYCDMRCPGGGNRLARHLGTAHADKFRAHGRNTRYGRTYCICGKVYRSTASCYRNCVDEKTLAEHLAERGGLVAHILEVTLGVEQAAKP